MKMSRGDEFVELEYSVNVGSLLIITKVRDGPVTNTVWKRHQSMEQLREWYKCQWSPNPSASAAVAQTELSVPQAGLLPYAVVSDVSPPSLWMTLALSEPSLAWIPPAPFSRAIPHLYDFSSSDALWKYSNANSFKTQCPAWHARP